MAAVPPPEDDRPATRRDLVVQREVIEAKTQAEFALVRKEMAEGFAAVRQEMAEGFAAVRKEIAEIVAELRAVKVDQSAVRRELRIQWMVTAALWTLVAGLILRN